MWLKLLGQPSSSGELMSSYELENEFVQIIYAKGPPCGSSLVDMWRVPRNTVVTIRIVPKNRLPLSTVLENQAYVKSVDPTNRGVFIYTNEESGLRYTVQSDGQISEQGIVSIDYSPSKSDVGLKCSSSSRSNDGIEPIPTFERYGNISLSMEKAILDNFAIQLQANKELRGYVVVYGNQAAQKRKGNSRLRFIKDYLTHVRGVPTRRIVYKERERRAGARIELFLVSPGKSGPNVKTGGAH